MGLRKREYQDHETIITAENMNDIQNAILMLEDGLFTVDNDKSGEVINITDAAKRGFRSLSIFGKTTQNGTPTPDAPVDLVSVGDSGSITVNVAGENESQNMTIATPNGLPGIPVTSGGNYTDANGQQWICDEIDFARGVYVQRVQHYSFNGTEEIYAPYWSSTGFSYDVGKYGYPLPHNGASDVPTVCNYLYNSGSTLNSFVLNGMLYFRYIGSFANKSEVASWLKECLDSGNPFSVIYPLETPIETPLSEEELAAYADLHTYKDNTTVFNDAGAYMELEYVMDAKKYIDSRISTGILEATVE